MDDIWDLIGQFLRVFLPTCYADVDRLNVIVRMMTCGKYKYLNKVIFKKISRCLIFVVPYNLKQKNDILSEKCLTRKGQRLNINAKNVNKIY